MSKVEQLVTEVVDYAVMRMESDPFVDPDVHQVLWKYTSDNLTPDLLMEIIEANSSGALGEVQTIGSLSEFYGPSVPVSGVLGMFAADLIADEAMSVLNDMGYDLPY